MGRSDGATVAAVGYADGMLRLWATADGRPLRIYRVGPSNANLGKVEISADGRRLAVLNGNGTVSILRLQKTP